jgi:hypothetical protein
MKRKSFLIISGIGLITLCGPVYFGIRGYRNKKYVLSQPESLVSFCDDLSLRQMGEKYLELYPEEQNSNLLIGLLDCKEYSQENHLRKQLQKNIRRDFESNLTLLLNGWVVSRTEARQCALFSLMQQE